jgi:hypothetical protein
MALVQTALDAPFNATITLASLASGAARQSSFIANTGNRGAAKVTLRVTNGAVAPANGTAIELWLVRRSAVGNADDNCGTTDAAYPSPPGLPRNATLLSAISVINTANQVQIATFDTAPAGPLGDDYAFAVANRSDQALNATAGNHSLTVETYLPDIV